MSKYRYEFTIILPDGSRVDDSCETLGNNGYQAQQTMKARYGSDAKVLVESVEKVD
jgi:hypothetical protein